jgi:hypothetical protein
MALGASSSNSLSPCILDPGGLREVRARWWGIILAMGIAREGSNGVALSPGIRCHFHELTLMPFGLKASALLSGDAFGVEAAGAGKAGKDGRVAGAAASESTPAGDAVTDMATPSDVPL